MNIRRLAKKIAIGLCLSSVLAASLASCGEDASEKKLGSSIGGITAEKEEATVIGNIKAAKTASHRISHTASPGEKITYTLTLENLENRSETVILTDSVPEYTEYVDGNGDVDGKNLSWRVTLGAGQTRKISYTVRVLDDASLCDGKAVEPTAARLGDTEFTVGYPIYIEKTFNEPDGKFIDYAVDALADSTFEDLTLLKWIYYVAYSQSSTLGDGDAYEIIDAVATRTASAELLDKIAPTLYGGMRIIAGIDGVKGAPAEAVTEADLISGDIIITAQNRTAKCYIYSNNGIYSVARGCVRVDTEEFLGSLPNTEAFAVFRVSSAFKSFTPTDPDRTPDTLTEKQKAIVDTAKYYLQRGQWLQYDDTYFCAGSTELGNESRWEAGLKSPEEFTSQNIGHINCAAFTHDVYWTVFGHKLPSAMYTTRNLTNESLSHDMKMYSFTRNVGDVHTDEEKALVEREFLETLQPGDIMVTRRTSNGHAMLYIGDGLFIHSSGSSYKYDGTYGVEVYEPTIRYNRVMDYFFNESSTNGYVFGNVTSLCIVRPLNNPEWAEYEVTENAKNRVDSLMGITAEKLPSAHPGVTVNQGEEITYTFSVRNDNSEDKTLDITDRIALGTEYVSGGDRINGDNIYFTLTVPARSTVEVSYTVRVKADTEDGFVIESNEAKIAGVLFKTYTTTVKRTLTDAEAEKLVATFNQLKNSGTTLRDLAIVNELYKKTFGIDYDIFDTTVIAGVCEGDGGIFTSEGLSKVGGKQAYKINPDGRYFDMVAPTLYGGRRLSTPSNEDRRTHLGYPEHLKVGDIFIGRTSSSYVLFMHVGAETFVNLLTLEFDGTPVAARLERGPAYSYYYAVLRPSFFLE